MDLDKIGNRLMLLSEYKFYMMEDDEEETQETQDDEELDLEAGDDLGDDVDLGDDEITNDEEDLGSLEDLEGEPTDEPVDDTSEDEVEVDVTGIVDNVETNQQKITDVESKIEDLGSKFDSYIQNMEKVSSSLGSKLSQMTQNLEREIVKRNPTPHEQLTLRSMSAYPYNIRLSDYWTPTDNDEYRHSIQNGGEDKSDYQIKVKSKDSEDETPKEYILTQDDIDKEYNETDVRDSL